MTQNRGNDIGRLSYRVDLEQVSRILLMYGEALAGAKVQIHSCEDSARWIYSDIRTTDGTTIFLPLYVDKYDSREENFAWYKVAVTHQAGHIEFGTFNFSFEKAVCLFPNQRHRLPATREIGLTDIEKFFRLFGDRKLSSDIFARVEDIRIDFLLKREYGGIRNSYQQIQKESLSRRPPLSTLPLREAFLEILFWIGLGSEPTMIPPVFRGLLKSMLSILQRVQSVKATAEDSAEATLRLYEIVSTIPNMWLPSEYGNMNDLGGAELIAAHDVSDVGDNEKNNTLQQGTGLPYQSSVEPELRCDSDTEPISLEDIKRFTNMGIDPTEVLRDQYPSSGFYVADFVTGTQAQEVSSDEQDEDKRRSRLVTLAETIENKETQSFLYDEWDFRSCCYLPRWCRVREMPMPDGNADFFGETLHRNSALAIQLRKQFEMLIPQRVKKLTRLQDGEDFDLNAVIESVVERKAGNMPNEKIYWKSMNMQRDIAVVFLIDMSASTAELIKDANKGEGYPDRFLTTMEAPSQSKTYLTEGLTNHPRRRVIDMMKESIVLMANALEIIGDCYGVYGFSSSGRDNVELRVIKGIDEAFSHTVERRIDGIRPLFSTRMGPAIRHTTAKLESHKAKTKILILVSDGYPQDRDYGLDSDDKEYALHDTEMALIEAKRMSIVPFSLTIDATGYDFLKEMSHDIDHKVIRSIESLPQHLPILYKRLTS